MKKILASMCCLVLAVSMGAAGVAASAEEIMPENPDNEVIESTKDVLPEKSGAAVEQEASGAYYTYGGFTFIVEDEYVYSDEDNGEWQNAATITGFDQTTYAEDFNKQYNSNYTLEFPSVIPAKYSPTNTDITVRKIMFDRYNGIGWKNGKDSLTFKKIIIPKTVQSIDSDSSDNKGNRTFESLNKLEEVVFEKGTLLKTYLGFQFGFCTNLKRIGVGNSYNLPSLAKIPYPHIWDDAFRDCKSLEEIVIPENITFIRQNAFDGCDSLKKVSIPSTIEVIGDGTFRNCKSLNSVEFRLDKNGKSNLGLGYSGAFALEGSSYSETTKFGGGAFEGCSSLQQLKLPLTNEPKGYSIGVSCFKNSGLRGINIPPCVTSVASETFAGTKLQDSNNILKTPKGESYGIAFFGNTTIDDHAFSTQVSPYSNEWGDNMLVTIAGHTGMDSKRYYNGYLKVQGCKFIELGDWNYEDIDKPLKPEKVKGDINGDGKVTNKDITQLQMYLVGWNVSVNKDSLDVNGDGKTTNKDITQLQMYLVGWDVKIY